MGVSNASFAFLAMATATAISASPAHGVREFRQRDRRRSLSPISRVCPDRLYRLAICADFRGRGGWADVHDGPRRDRREKAGWFWFWGFTVVAAIPGMILLWAGGARVYVVEGIRQTDAVDEGKLSEPIGVVRIFGSAVAVVGLVALLLSQPLRWENSATWASAAILLAGGLIARLGKPSPEVAGSAAEPRPPDRASP